jgi:hypothetical protein
MVAASRQFDWSATFGTPFVLPAVIFLKLVKINKSNQVVRLITVVTSMPRPSASETIDLSTL